MSHKTYDEYLKKTQDLLTATLQIEPVQADRRAQRNLLATLYIRYILIANKLTECVDQMVQPQKRLLIRKLLEATLGRILELKSDLVEADLNEYTNCGDVLESLSVTPLETEIVTPKCFLEEREEELTYRYGMIEAVLDKLGYSEPVVTKPPMTEAQAILIIQVHERARQGRLRAQFMREIRTMKDKTKPAAAAQDGEAPDDATGIPLSAAMKIQKIWRGYVDRRATRRRKLQEMLLIGMIPPPKSNKLSPDVELDGKIKQKRRALQLEYWKIWKRQVEKCRENLEKTQRAAVLEQLSDQVRGWLHEYKTQTGKIPEYTGSERTGSRMMFSRQGTDSELSKSTQISSKESKGKKDKTTSKSPSGKDDKTQAGEADDEQTSKALVSTFIPELNLRKEEYDEIWKNRDETSNPKQLPYHNMIYQEQMADMENELKKVVDEMMRAELQLLQEALEKDRGHKAKKRSSKKARRGGKKAKKKKEKDLTPDRTTESLFEELVANGIIKKYPQISLQTFLGERSYYNPVPHDKGKSPPIALGDTRQLLQEYCIIPLLTPQLHQNTPHVKSVMLAGARGSGKDMLVHAICTETGSMLFDLTPANIVGKYPGKSGLIMLVHLVVKVARLLQPSVIYMDCAERPFVKKIAKGDKSDPKRLKKDLPKLVKNLSPEDRVILIGVSNCPWESDQKLLQQVYQKFLLVPRPEYASRYSIWTFLLNKYLPTSWQFDISVMSKISDGYSVGSIIATILEVMTVKRVLQLKIHPLSPLELVNALCKRLAVYKEEDEAMEQWWTRVPIVRRRIRAVEMLLEMEAEMQAKQASAKKK